MSRAIDNLALLKRCKDFEEVHQSAYFQEHFVKRYINNIPLMALELFNVKLTYQQIEVLDNHDWEGGRLVVPSGHGCHGINTPIMMSDGSIKMVQDVKEGECLMGDDGITPREVLSLARGEEELYHFVTNDGTERVYNKSHILTLIATQTHGTQKKGEITHIKLSEWLNWSDRKKRTHAFYKSHTVGEDTQLPIDPYFLGVWLGDGSSQSLSITNIDKQVIDYIEKYAHSLGCIMYQGECGKKTQSYAISNGNRTHIKLSKEFKKLGLYGNKHIPQIFKQSSVEQRLELLAGIIDTDGSLDKRNKRVFEITQKSKALSFDIVYLARSCGLHATIRKVKKSCLYKGERKVGDYYQIGITRNTEIIPTKIKRKQAEKILNPQRNNLNFGIKEYKKLGMGDYYGFEIDGNHKFLDGDFIVQHNTGKTKLIGVLASAHFLLFRYSITRVQAPKEDQVTKFSFKEITSCLNAIWNKRKIYNKKTKEYRVIESKWAFLKKFIQINTKSFYIKGFQKQWYIEPATAPKGDPTNLSGQHNWSYLLIFDEMSGIPDSHVQGSLGALSERFNSCIGFSQHTTTTGMFNSFVTTQSVSMGGVWKVVRLNSEESPRVDVKSIRSWRSTYTENEYNVRVLGLPPLFEDGYLLNTNEVMRAYSKENKPWLDDMEMNILTVSTDIAYVGLRDSSVIVKMRLAVRKDSLGRSLLYIIIDDIDVYVGRTAKLPTEVSKLAFTKMLETVENDDGTIKVLKQAIDANAGGHEAFIKLREHVEGSGLENASVTGVLWGSKRMSGLEKRRFFNQRAKANIMLQEAIKQNRLYIATKKQKTRLMNELSHIPFSFTADFKYKMLDKDAMKQLGINSPDIVDSISQQFILYYEEVGENEVVGVPDAGDNKEIDDEFEVVDLEINDDIENLDNEFDNDGLGDLEGTTIV